MDALCFQQHEYHEVVKVKEINDPDPEGVGQQ